MAEDFEYSLYEIFNKNKAQSSFYKSVPLTYIMDDHDLGSNNADMRSPSAAEANTAYANSVRRLDRHTNDKNKNEKKV